MNDSAIKYFRVDAPPAWVQFDATNLQDVVLLESKGDAPGSYSVRFETIRAQRPNISDQQYADIKRGMTYEQVLGIVKIPGKEAAGGGNVQIYTWGTEVYVYMVVTLVDGKVQSKSH
ncbi:hypothetical protein [Pseudomonas sp. NPDC086278]|uniref:hypothetical protein n=1 Tax=Pseudomonas sp. NPDC086278 TaxID=3390646 RepID=UPI003D04A9AF